MFGINELKEHIEISDTAVECPVKDCKEKVKRQRNHFKKEEQFRCPKHNIYISPTTFEYSCESDNLLWKDNADLDILKKIKYVKRESRIDRDNSEDAFTWNVFRFLEKNNLVDTVIGSAIGADLKSSEVIYWSYSQKECKGWSVLNEARKKFGEKIEQGSEPDIIIKTDNALLFIEAKLTATNKTHPSNKSNSKKYKTGGDSWFSKVFKSDYETVAIIEEKYELLRFWLLGTWLAKSLELDFYLINLVLSEREKDIESDFKKYIIEIEENKKRKFIRITWEYIYSKINNISLSEINRDIINYFENKSAGYKIIKDGKVGELKNLF